MAEARVYSAFICDQFKILGQNPTYNKAKLHSSKLSRKYFANILAGVPAVCQLGKARACFYLHNEYHLPTRHYRAVQSVLPA